MKWKLVLVAALGALALSGCAKKRVPIGAESYAPGAGAPYSADAGEAELSRLQADLIASAGRDRVFFEFDAYTLSPEARQTLARQANWLREHPGLSFSIEGHADERGTREYNLALGDRRARAAAEYLILEGISPARIRTISYGKERPEALGSDEGAYSQNRRAVSVVIRNDGG